MPLAIVVAMGVGCGGPATVPVTGTVTLDGEPVDGASVMFVAEGEGRPASGTTDGSGNFTLTTFTGGDGALPGSYKVTVFKTAAPTEADTAGEDTGAAGEESEGEINPDVMGADVSVEAESILPVKYSVATTTDLTVEVKAGMQPVKLELTSE
jgi:hypothetical protein